MHNSTSFSQMLQEIDRGQFKKIVKSYGGDKGVRNLRSWDHFAAMLYGQLNKSHSLCEMVSQYNSCGSKLYHIGSKKVSRSTISDANNKRFKYISQIIQISSWEVRSA